MDKKTLYKCVVKNKGVNMSVNFGYGGYGMTNNMSMMNTMSQGGGTFQSIVSQYSCPTCYQYGPQPYNYQTYVNPLPPQAFHHSWLGRIFGKIFG